MGHDRRAGTKSPEEASLRELEDILTQAAEDGDLDDLIAEELSELGDEPVSADVLTGIRQGVQAQDELRQRLRVARKGIGSHTRALPDVLRSCREAAGIALEDIAVVLRTSATTLRRIENGELDVLSLSPEFVAKLMALFTITTGELNESLKYYVARRAKASGLGALAARAPMAAAGELERALHDVAGMLAEEDGDVARAEIPASFLPALRRVLHRWGRDDLIR